MEKLVVVIDGAGGVGKDTLCAFAAKKYRVRNVSSADPIKTVARAGGWDGDKSDKSRSEDKDGVGLGLYIVKTILEQHKERINVTSEKGVTTFSFSLNTE